jgi:ribosomal protein L40E
MLGAFIRRRLDSRVCTHCGALSAVSMIPRFA